MTLRIVYVLVFSATLVYPHRATLAASWSETVCGAVTKSPLCALFNSVEKIPEDERLKQIREFYLAKLDKWASNAEPATMQDQVVSSCGMLTIVTAPADTARNFVKGEEREEFDARVDACAKLTAQRAWPQPEFAKPQTVDLVCNRWTSLLRDLCIRAKLNA
ncbi:hypothetical protein JQ631_18760 [Bradyrhizobium manausense]|uniref:hypothetical protein n=1 Tax=Bradyrhizobium manausense TaxID=989370 RepID=UPI001BA60917|nr:hypothetical protein [Bradyrhizobium manausense]MBR0791124.1 hypothetical protein [Bradyrhizobium manausense]